MKANEMMIGDLVQVILTQSHPAETSQNVIEKYTSEKEQIIRCEYVMPNSIAFNKYYEDLKITMSIPVVEEYIYPIPITPEILEANGFRESIEEGTYYFPTENEEINDRGFAIETFNDGVWFITDHILMQFMYIHQLQHALRLCGLNEIADSIKI